MGVINYADKYSNILDEKFKVESKSDIAVNQDYDFVGAKTVKIQSVNTVELSNYKPPVDVKEPEEIDPFLKGFRED